MLRSIIACSFLATVPTLALAAEDGTTPRVVEREIGGDRFTAGSELRIAGAVAGDLIAAGGELDVRAQVAGDAALAAGKIRSDGSIAQDAYLAGGQLAINGAIGRNARIAGGQVETGVNSTIAGNASIAGGEVRLRGGVAGFLTVAGGRVLLDGVVDHDVTVTAREVELGPSARIAGKLRYTSRKVLREDPAAQVAGGIERVPFPAGMREWGRGERRYMARGAGLLWVAGLMLMAGLWIAFLPGVATRIATTARGRFGWSLLLGFVLLVCIPAAIIVMLATVIGIPLALLTLLLYIALLLTGYVAGCMAVGDWALARARAAAVAHRGWRIAAAVAAVLVIALLVRVPILGGLLSLVVLLLGIGAIAMQFAPRRATAAGQETVSPQSQ